MTRRILPSAAFNRTVKRLAKTNPGAVAGVRAALDRLAADASDPRLQTHKLKGDLSGRWACSAGYDLRIVFRFVPYDGAEAILLQSVGTHDDVY